jgi:hypothetical protein
MPSNTVNEDDDTQQQNNLSVFIPTLFFLFPITLIPTLINFVGTYIGYACMTGFGVDFSHSENRQVFINATNQTITNYTKKTEHAVCGTANTTFVNPSGFAMISAISALPIFFSLAIFIILFRLGCGKRDNYRTNLWHDAHLVPGANFVLSAVLPFSAGFFLFCFEILDALKIAGACFFGSNIIMFVALFAAVCANAARNCYSPTKINASNGTTSIATTPTATRIIEVQPQERRLSTLSFQSVSPHAVSLHESSSAIFSPRSPEAQTPLPNPLNSSQSSEPIRRGPGHARTSTDTYKDGP